MAYPPFGKVGRSSISVHGESEIFIHAAILILYQFSIYLYNIYLK
jgi:hypothetical protein